MLGSSRFTDFNKVLIFLGEKNKLLSSAKMVKFKIFEEFGGSLTYIRKTSGSRIDPCGW